jgi:hypothetical protein
MQKNISKRFIRPFLGTFLALLVIGLQHCEMYSEETYEMSAMEEAACELLNDTLSVDVMAADLRVLGPEWTGSNIDAALASTARIGATWMDADFLIEPDVFVFVDGADTLAALRFLSHVYDSETDQVDSIRLVYKYNAVGDPNLAGLDLDTLLITGTESAVFYLNFSQGPVGSSDVWHLSIDGTSIIQSQTTRVHRLEDVTLASVTVAPTGTYLADGSGHTLAIETLEADSIYLMYPDSLQIVEIENISEAGYLLWDRSSLGSGEITFHASDYMSISVWDEAGMEIEPLDMSISMELIAYCPDVRTMNKYELTAETYLIQFLPNEAMASPTFHLALLEGN